MKHAFLITVFLCTISTAYTQVSQEIKNFETEAEFEAAVGSMDDHSIFFYNVGGINHITFYVHDGKELRANRYTGFDQSMNPDLASYIWENDTTVLVGLFNSESGAGAVSRLFAPINMGKACCGLIGKTVEVGSIDYFDLVKPENIILDYSTENTHKEDHLNHYPGQVEVRLQDMDLTSDSTQTNNLNDYWISLYQLKDEKLTEYNAMIVSSEVYDFFIYTEDEDGYMKIGLFNSETGRATVAGIRPEKRGTSMKIYTDSPYTSEKGNAHIRDFEKIN